MWGKSADPNFFYFSRHVTHFAENSVGSPAPLFRLGWVAIRLFANIERHYLIELRICKGGELLFTFVIFIKQWTVGPMVFVLYKDFISSNINHGAVHIKIDVA